MPDLITTNEAAKILSMKPSKLRQLRLHWRGPPFYKLGGSVLYDRRELLAWFRAGRCEPPPHPLTNGPGRPSKAFAERQKLAASSAASRRKASVARDKADAHATA